MYSDRGNNGIGVLGGMLLGITAGALAVILSDKKNREQLSETATDVKKRVHESAKALKKKGDDEGAKFDEAMQSF